MAFLLTETVEDSSALSPARPDLLLFYSGKKTIANDESKNKVDNNVSDGDLVTYGGGCLWTRWRNSSKDNEDRRVLKSSKTFNLSVYDLFH